jgi:glycosyltransferase involved in cell wall biosynthesis
LNEIICPNCFQNLMVQRPHQLLRQFARNGYKAVLHNINEKERRIMSPAENYLVYDGISFDLPKSGKRILWISYPPLYKKIGTYNEDFLVYDCIDYPGERFAHWSTGVTELQKRADAIFVTSSVLYNFNREYCDKTFLCSNGADFDFFAKAADNQPARPNDMAGIKKPIVGYIGAVADWIDWQLIEFIAAAGKFAIVFVGPLFGLNRIPVVSEHIYFLGRKDYDALPSYLSCFDVCLIPFKKNKLTSACSPVKMYEYLSMGKPVVTTDLEECRIDVVKCSRSYQEFYKNIVDSLGAQSHDAVQSRMSFAKKNSWENKVACIRSAIEPMLENPPSFQ